MEAAEARARAAQQASSNHSDERDGPTGLKVMQLFLALQLRHLSVEPRFHNSTGGARMLIARAALCTLVCYRAFAVWCEYKLQCDYAIAQLILSHSRAVESHISELVCRRLLG